MVTVRLLINGISKAKSKNPNPLKKSPKNKVSIIKNGTNMLNVLIKTETKPNTTPTFK